MTDQTTMDPPTNAAGQATEGGRFEGALETWLRREWLITNGRGGFASGTPVGVPTRRYHGLLIAAARPPLERWLLLAQVLERIGLSGRHHELAAFDFGNLFHPNGHRYQTDFAFDNHPVTPWVRFTYRHDGMALTKHLIMVKDRDEVHIRYHLQGPAGAPVSLEVCPFLAMRDFHALTHAFPGSYPIQEIREYVTVDIGGYGPRLWLCADRLDGGEPVSFQRRPDWWYGFFYREEAARGLDSHEDLFVPGWFTASGSGSIEMELRAIADFTEDHATLPERSERIVVPESRADRSVEERLRQAASAFVVGRRGRGESLLTTIIAGYPWFGDWGRDTFIALPGLLLETQRFAEARQVLEVFASAQQDGLIPNRFSDYGDGRDYNSVDASLWYIHGATAYVDATGDQNTWRNVLGPACLRIVDAFVAGTKFRIHVESDGLVTCGDESTQLTWMDAKCGEIVFTPRHGKPVEINALWYHGLCAMADHLESYDPQRTVGCRELAGRAAQSFTQAFWNQADQCLYDVVRDGWADPAIRPNQIFAVSLPHSLLNEAQQRAVLAVVERELLTPFGLRSLSRDHPSYRGRYEGGPFERDSIYHQGTVWGWLIGPYVEAYLRVHGFTPEAKRRMREQLVPLVNHLNEAGLESVSEIFDGDPPHTPRGSVAQAWSVSELLRAWRLCDGG